MAIAKEAIDKFLYRVPPELPRFKGERPDKLLELIYDCTSAQYQEITTSKPHQLEGVAYALYMRRCLLYYWMRRGKTKIALDWISHLQRSGLARRKALIVAHSPLGCGVWEQQAGVHSKLKVRAVYSGKRAADDFVDATESDVDAIIISHSTLQSLFTIKKASRKGPMKLYPDHELLELAAEAFDTAVIDEIHLVGGQYAPRFLLLCHLLGECRYRLGLTGTPVGRNPLGVWPQVYLIDEGHTLSPNYRFFERAFCVYKTAYNIPGKPKRLIFDRTKLDILNQKLATISLTSGKDEVKSAEVDTQVVELRLSEEQRKAYNDIIQGVIDRRRAQSEQERTNTFVRLRQISSGYLSVTGEDDDTHVVHFKRAAKLEWLEDLLEVVDADTQVLIFHEYRYTGELLEKIIKKAGRTCVRLYGDTKDKFATAALFQQRKVQFLIANNTTGGTAVDLSAADYQIFYETPVSPRVREQAQARAMARGMRPLLLDDLVCGAIDRRVLDFIQEGRDVAHALLHAGKDWFAALREN